MGDQAMTAFLSWISCTNDIKKAWKARRRMKQTKNSKQPKNASQKVEGARHMLHDHSNSISQNAETSPRGSKCKYEPIYLVFFKEKESGENRLCVCECLFPFNGLDLRSVAGTELEANLFLYLYLPKCSAI